MVLVCGQAVQSQCDPYSLYVQLSRSTSLSTPLQGIMLLSKVRGRNIVGNTVPENMVAAERRLEELNKATIREAGPGYSLLGLDTISARQEERLGLKLDWPHP
jgi:hypothetical protein